MSCDNLCTAAKCEELENRISALEQALELLEASFEAHTNQEIPTAHNYNSNIKIDGSYQSNTLTLTVADKTSQDTATIQIPDSNVTVSLAADSSNTLKVFVAVGSKNDSETIKLPEPEVTVSLAVADQDLKVFVAVGSKNDSETIKLPLPNPFDLLDLLKLLLLGELKDDLKDLIRDLLGDLVQSLENLLRDYLDDLLRNKFNFSVDTTFNDRQLTTCVSNGLFRDCSTVRISDRIGGGGGGGGGNGDDNGDYLSGSGSLSESGILTINIDSSIGSANIQIDLPLPEILKLLEEVHDATVVQITGSTPTAFLCAVDATDEPVDNQSTEYAGTGILGLHALTRTVNENLVTVFGALCQQESPIAAIPEWWQVRTGSDRPQLVVIYKGGDSYWSITIPWYRGVYGNVIIKQMPSYTRGAFATYLTLNDNSKIVVNAESKIAGETFINRVKSLVSSSMLSDSRIQSGGERKGKLIAKVGVKPAYAKYFAKGQKDQLPDWGYNFITDKWVKYARSDTQ